MCIFLAEGFPENHPIDEPLDFVNGGFGNLEKSTADNRTDPASINKEAQETVTIPEGMTESEFVQSITDAVDSYDNSADYDALPNDTGEGVNSNSFVGSVLRKSGSDFTPSRNAPGFGKNIFTQPKFTTITLLQRASKAYQSVKKVITDFF